MKKLLFVFLTSCAACAASLPVSTSPEVVVASPATCEEVKARAGLCEIPPSDVEGLGHRDTCTTFENPADACCIFVDGNCKRVICTTSPQCLQWQLVNEECQESL